MNVYFCAMGKGKLQKFAELEHMKNVIQKPEPKQYKGNWAKEFGNKNPITLELACGKGDYTLALARRFPERNFIGVDIKGNRIHVGARQAIAEDLHHVRFLRQYIDHIDEQFEVDEVSEIWITFPDPYLRESKANKRLTSPVFLNRYRNILQSNGVIHLKTDSPELYDYTKEVIAELGLHLQEDIQDVHKNEKIDPLLTSITTYYEKMHLGEGKNIYYLRFQL